MKKILIAGVLVAVFAAGFAGCTDNEEKDTTSAPSTVTTTQAMTDMMGAASTGMSEAGEDLSKGASKVGEDLSKGASKVGDGLDHAATNISEALS